RTPRRRATPRAWMPAARVALRRGMRGRDARGAGEVDVDDSSRCGLRCGLRGAAPADAAFKRNEGALDVGPRGQFAEPAFGQPAARFEQRLIRQLAGFIGALGLTGLPREAGADVVAPGAEGVARGEQLRGGVAHLARDALRRLAIPGGRASQLGARAR